MFDKFGEFDSVEELNRAAAAQLKEGDLEALKELAAENGISDYDVQDYIDGAVDKLATPLLAAAGKLELEQKDLKLSGILSDWVSDLVDMCSSSEEMCNSVRKKGKSLAGYIAELAEDGYAHRVNVDPRIVQLTRQIKGIVGSHGFAIGVPDKRTRRRLAEEYYLGTGEKGAAV